MSALLLEMTRSPEFMAALEGALATAAAKLSRETAAKGDDPEDVWLNAREARAFLRMAESTWYAFKKEQEELTANERDLVISYSLKEARYQLASLQRFMRKGAVGLPDPLPGMRDLASTKPNGKQRGVSVGAPGRR